MALYI
jgi:uncharacterized C2H2 Zn-finger protein